MHHQRPPASTEIYITRIWVFLAFSEEALMKSAMGQHTWLAGALCRLEAAGLSVVGVTTGAPSGHHACSARRDPLRPPRSSHDRVTFVLVATVADAQAVRTAILGTGLRTLPKLEPPSFGRHASAEEAWLTKDLAPRASVDNGSSPVAVKLAGDAHVSPVRDSGQLSARETEVLHLFAHGALPSQVAQQLYVSPKTVKNHLSHIYAKLGVANRTQAVAVAVRLGIVTIA